MQCTLYRSILEHKYAEYTLIIYTFIFILVWIHILNHEIQLIFCCLTNRASFKGINKAIFLLKQIEMAFFMPNKKIYVETSVKGFIINN